MLETDLLGGFNGSQQIGVAFKSLLESLFCLFFQLVLRHTAVNLLALTVPIGNIEAR
jgi:hypothetical protein